VPEVTGSNLGQGNYVLWAYEVFLFPWAISSCLIPSSSSFNNHDTSRRYVANTDRVVKFPRIYDQQLCVYHRSQAASRYELPLNILQNSKQNQPEHGNYPATRLKCSTSSSWFHYLLISNINTWPYMTLHEPQMVTNMGLVILLAPCTRNQFEFYGWLNLRSRARTRTRNGMQWTACDLQ
jgi:hypothetical protein